jgi:hypothetical protein
MCKQGTYASVELNDFGFGKKPTVLKTIDACIAPLVQVLNKYGYKTTACCCGHGKTNGVISLKDGRELLIARNYSEARLMEKAIVVKPEIFSEEELEWAKSEAKKLGYKGSPL